VKHLQTISMSTHFDRVRQLLSHSLYDSSGAFVRELLQNASDAIQRRRELTPAHAGRIELEISPREQRLSIRDNGIGMRRMDVVQLLAVVGASGTAREQDRLEGEGHDDRAEELIGTFGVGLLSALRVAESIVVHTRHAKSRAGWRWEWDGSPSSSLARQTGLPVGTEVSLQLGPEHAELLDADLLGNLVLHHADLLPSPIHLRERGAPFGARDPEAPLNRGDAPWHLPSWSDPRQRAAQLQSFFRREARGALAVIPVHLELPIRARGVLFISRSGAFRPGDGKLEVYVRRMRVCQVRGELLPPWASFLSGVIESPDLHPNTSREGLLRDVVFGGLRDQLGAVALEYLGELAIREPERAKRLFDRLPSVFKGLVLLEESFLDSAGHLLRFDSNHGAIRLGEALSRASGAARTTTLHFRASRQAIGAESEDQTLVIDAHSALDRAVLERVAERFPDRIRLREIQDALPTRCSVDLSEEERAVWRDLEDEMTKTLKRRGLTDLPVRVERLASADLPSLLCAEPAAPALHHLAGEARSEGWLTPGLARATRELVSSRRTKPEKDVLRVVLNANSPILRNLRESVGDDDPLRDATLVCLAGSALLRAGALVRERHVPVVDAHLRALLAHASRSLRIAPSLPGMAIGVDEEMEVHP
jgi:molecular chaperone HtpG